MKTELKVICGSYKGLSPLSSFLAEQKFERAGSPSQQKFEHVWNFSSPNFY